MIYLFYLFPDKEGESISGRTYFGETVLANGNLTVEYTSKDSLSQESLNVSIDERGIFAFLLPSNSTIHNIIAESSRMRKGSMGTYLSLADSNYRSVGESISTGEVPLTRCVL